MIRKTYHHPEPLKLELGYNLTELVICYHISEEPIDPKKPVVWICHALTANSNAEEWWPGMVGEGKFFDPSKYTIICANIIGSCYGSTGPLSMNPATGKQWLNDFPLITVRDWASALDALRRHLGIDRIYLATGGSIGGFQCMEWAIMYPDTIENMALIVTSYTQSPWAIAINETERMAIEADPTFFNGQPGGGKVGLAAARAIGLLTYRGYEAYNQTQAEENVEEVAHFRASSYQRYQGKKLVDRFDAHCYHAITRSQDTHNVGRGRGGIEKALGMIKSKTLSIGISSDILFPTQEQKMLAKYIPGASYAEIHSDFGHDGFLIENNQLEALISRFLNIGSHANEAY